MSNAFSEFIDGVAGVLGAHREPADIVTRIEPFLRTLVLDRDWLEPNFQQALPDKPYSQYLLFRPPDRSFSVVSFVWRPDNGSPVHDHCTWGVIGQYEGMEEETRFLRRDDGSDPDVADIEEVSVGVFGPGAVAHVYPPDRDIHRIYNRTETPTVSIHIYGGDIGTQQRHVFELSTGHIKTFVSGYDEPLPD